MLPPTMGISDKKPSGRQWSAHPAAGAKVAGEATGKPPSPPHQLRETHSPIEARTAPVTAAYMAESDFAASVEREHQDLVRHQKRVSEGIQCLREMGIPTP